MFEMKEIKILLVDDHVLFRKGLFALLSSREGMQIVGEAGDGWEAIEKARVTNPDVILMDVHMPKCDGPKAVRVIHDEMPGIKIVMITMDDDDSVLFESIKSGAQGFILKKLTPQYLYDTLEKVAQGEVALSPLIISKILSEYQHPTNKTDSSGVELQALTQREKDVLQKIVDGATNQEIAEALNITENTVKKHLQSILYKLHLNNRIQAAVFAVREGLFDNTPRED
jgi:DNA-binding NarL/FixJ family response regulator